MKVNELAQGLKGFIEPCYLLTGKILYLQEKAMRLFNHLVDGITREFNYSRFSGVLTVDEAINSLNTSPIMSEFRLTIWESGSSNLAPAQINSVVESFKKYCANPNPTSILVIIDDAEKLKALYKYTTVVDCASVDKYDLIGEANAILASHQLSANSAVLNEIIERSNDDLCVIDSEIIKLKQYIFSNIITMQDVEACMPRTLIFKVYELSDAIAKHNNTKAFKVASELLSRGEEPTTLLARLTTYYKQAFYARISKIGDEELRLKFNMKQYPFKLLKDSAAAYKPTELKYLLEQLEQLEYRIKIGTIEPKEAIFYAVCKLASK